MFENINAYVENNSIKFDSENAGRIIVERINPKKRVAINIVYNNDALRNTNTLVAQFDGDSTIVVDDLFKTLSESSRGLAAFMLWEEVATFIALMEQKIIVPPVKGEKETKRFFLANGDVNPNLVYKDLFACKMVGKDITLLGLEFLTDLARDTIDDKELVGLIEEENKKRIDIINK